MGAPMPAGLRPEHPPEWAIPCPLAYCAAKPGLPCKSRVTGQALTGGSHPSRLDAHLVARRAA